VFLTPQLGNRPHVGTGVFGIAFVPPHVPPAGLLVASGLLLRAFF
jgi:hypothetical protein